MIKARSLLLIILYDPLKCRKYYKSSFYFLLIFIGFAIVVMLLMAAGLWIQELRVKAAACEGAEDVKLKYERLVENYEGELERDRDARIKTIDNSQHPCLDVRSADILRGNKIQVEPD